MIPSTMSRKRHYNYYSEAEVEEVKEPKQNELQQVEKESSNFEGGDS